MRNNVKKKKMSIDQVLFIVVAVTIPVVQWLLFYVYSNISAFSMAFTNKDHQVTLEHFVRFVNEFKTPDSEIRVALKNTLLTFAITLAAYPFQVLVSYFLYKKVPGSKFFRYVFFIPQVLFSICTAMVFSRLVGVNGFIAKGISEWLHLDYVPELLADERFANYTIWAQMLWLSFPGSLIIWGGTFARIPEEVLEAGRVDGTNWWTEFTRIIVPLVWPTVSLQLVLSFCNILGASGAVFLLTKGNYGTMTLNCWTYLQVINNRSVATGSNAYHYLSAVGLVMTIVAVSISRLVRKITDRFFSDLDF